LIYLPASLGALPLSLSTVNEIIDISEVQAVPLACYSSEPQGSAFLKEALFLLA
jgi:hypothetical protein